MDSIDISPGKGKELKPPNIPEAFENDEFPPPPDPNDKEHMQIMGDENQYND